MCDQSSLRVSETQMDKVIQARQARLAPAPAPAPAADDDNSVRRRRQRRARKGV